MKQKLLLLSIFQSKNPVMLKFGQLMEYYRRKKTFAKGMQNDN